MTITASVQLVGVFVVFASLIVPALAAVAQPRRRLPLAWLTGAAGYALGLAGSMLLDLPTGAAIVCGLAMAAVVVATSLRPGAAA